jgi:CHASE2 domain-containing sensor protein
VSSVERRFDFAALALFGGAAAAWALRNASSPATSLLLRAIAVLLLAAALFRARRGISAIGAALLARLDAAEARLEKAPASRLIRAALIAAVVGAATLVIVESTRLGSYLETRTVDLFFRLRFPERSQVERATANEGSSARRQDDVVVLGLDDETISHLGWPMPRIHYARLIDVVSAAKPASLTFDVALVDPSREHPEWDLAIGEASKRAGNVGFTFTIARGTGDVPPTLSATALTALDANSIPFEAAANSLPDYGELIGADAVITPVIDPVAQNAQVLAMANVVLDGDDDVLRHSLLVARTGKRLLPSLSLRLAAQALEVPLDQVHVHPNSHVDLGGKRSIPTDRSVTCRSGRSSARTPRSPCQAT